MGNNEIQSWIDQARKAGISDIQIHEQLKTSGWTDEQVANAFGVSHAASVLAQHIQPKRKFKLGKIFGIAAAVIIVLAAGAVFASWKGYLPLRIPYLGTEVEQYLKSVAKSIKDVKSVETGFYVSMKAEPKTIKDGSIFSIANSIDKSITQSTGISLTPETVDIPKDFSVDGKVTIYLKDINKANSSGYGTIEGSYTADGKTYAVNAEFRNPGEKTFYLTVHKFPQIGSYNFDALLNKWVAYDTAEVSNTLEQLNVSKEEQKKAEAETKKLDDEIYAMGVIGIKTGFISVKFSGSEKISNQQTKKILVTLNPKKVDAFTQAYRKDVTKRKADITKVQAFLKILEDKTKRTSLTELLGTSSVTFWVNTKTKIPAKVELSTAIVPPSNTSTQQVRFNIGVTVAHFNEDLPIETPKETITTDEATSLVMMSLMGLTGEDANFQKQFNVLGQIGEALDTYNSVNGGYPETLDALLQAPLGNPGAGVKLEQKNYFYNLDSGFSFGPSTPITDTIPNDIFTGKPFVYTKDETGYTLVYTMHFAKPSTDSQCQGNDQCLNNSLDFSRYGDSLKSMFVDGINTATPNSISVEGENNPALTQAKVNARDAQRKSDLAQLRTALSLFYDDYNKYPYTSTLGVPDQSNNKDGQGAVGTILIHEGPMKNYLARELKGATADGKVYDRYFYLDDRTSASEKPNHYVLYTQLESNEGKYYYAINDDGMVYDDGTRWSEGITRTAPPTCVTGRTPVCGYAK